MIDEHFLLAALGHEDFDLVPGMGGEGLFEQLALRHLMRQQDERRQRLVVIELAKKRREQLSVGGEFVGPREVGAIAPVLAGAEEENLYTGLPALLRQGKEVRLIHPLRIYAL